MPRPDIAALAEVALPDLSQSHALHPDAWPRAPCRGVSPTRRRCGRWSVQRPPPSRSPPPPETKHMRHLKAKEQRASVLPGCPAQDSNGYKKRRKEATKTFKRSFRGPVWWRASRSPASGPVTPCYAGYGGPCLVDNRLGVAVADGRERVMHHLPDPELVGLRVHRLQAFHLSACRAERVQGARHTPLGRRPDTAPRHGGSRKHARKRAPKSPKAVHHEVEELLILKVLSPMTLKSFPFTAPQIF